MGDYPRASPRLMYFGPGARLGMSRDSERGFQRAGSLGVPTVLIGVQRFSSNRRSLGHGSANCAGVGRAGSHSHHGRRWPGDRPVNTRTGRSGRDARDRGRTGWGARSRPRLCGSAIRRGVCGQFRYRVCPSAALRRYTGSTSTSAMVVTTDVPVGQIPTQLSQPVDSALGIACDWGGDPPQADQVAPKRRLPEFECESPLRSLLSRGFASGINVRQPPNLR